MRMRLVTRKELASASGRTPAQYYCEKGIQANSTKFTALVQVIVPAVQSETLTDSMNNVQYFLMTTSPFPCCEWSDAKTEESFEIVKRPVPSCMGVVLRPLLARPRI
mmetsp:Transcript_4976/g.10041  ORF Transcript_4976/g.10041 Transcript_4976/m.10041 type:complete len:107 (-) Transcript_4976:1889-2209(-)